MADSLEQLDLDTNTIQSTGKGKGADIGILRFRQEYGLNTALPYGLELVGQRRIISSENASFIVPFRTKEIFEPGGIVYGCNEISRNLIMMNRMNYKNGNGFIVGDAGGGKSVLAKSEMYAVYVRPEAPETAEAWNFMESASGTAADKDMTGAECFNLSSIGLPGKETCMGTTACR